MERLRGTSLLTAQREQLERQAAARNMSASALRRELEDAFQSGRLTRSLVPSSSLLRLYGAFLGARDALVNAGLALWDVWYGSSSARVHTPRPLDAPRILELLFEVHGHQLLFDGFFNGDPHPGNIMLLRDGRVGLIDWGQVKRLGLDERLRLARLLIALADRDQVMAAQLWAECGFETARNDPWCLDKWATWRFARNSPDVFDELGGVMNFEKRLGDLDPITNEPQQYVMAFRLAALLRGSAMGLGDVTVDSSRRWRAQAVRLLKQHGQPLPATQPGRFLPSTTYSEARQRVWGTQDVPRQAASRHDRRGRTYEEGEGEEGEGGEGAEAEPAGAEGA